MRPDDRGLPLLGLVYLLVAATLIGASVLAYRKDLPWQASTDVTLVTDHPGLELNPGSDVKIQGRLVGRVDRVESDGRQATVHLSIDPDETALIPRNVDAAIVPKTLFGEKFVDLLMPAAPEESRLRAGDVITQSTTAVELGDVYAELVPLLRAVDPAQLSTVLSSLARTLDGRGEQLGRAIVQTDAFLAELNPHLGVLHADLRRLTTTLASYDEAAPDLLRTLASSSAISAELLVPAEARLQALLDTVVTTSQTTEEVLGDNADALITLTGRARPLLRVLDRYASVLPCSMRGLHLLDKLGNQVTGGRGPFTLLNVDVLVQGDPYVYPRDLPDGPRSDANVDVLPDLVPSWAPHCPRFGLLTRQVKDADPFSLAPLPFQSVAGDGSGAERSSSTRVTDPRLAQALGDELTGTSGSGGSGLAGLLVNPLLYDGRVTLP